MQKHTVIIKKCTVGYGVYDEPYFLNGEKHEGLYMTSQSIDGCIHYCEEHDFDYRIES